MIFNGALSISVTIYHLTFSEQSSGNSNREIGVSEDRAELEYSSELRESLG